MKSTTTFLILLFIIIFFQETSFAQNYKIIGKVVDSTTNEPMQFVNIILMTVQDSSQAAGTVTDEDGKFRLTNVSRGNYFIKISFIGYENHETKTFLVETSLNIGIIKISPSSLLLDEVSVTESSNSLISTLDKRIFNVDKDVLSQSGSVSEVLQNIPSVSVDVDGTVTLRGTSNITFLINGRPSAMLKRNAAMALQRIPASTIERIEVITNPSAKFKPDGTGGIINIIRKKSTGSGFNGELNADVGNEQRFRGGVSLNYFSDKINIFGNYSLRHSAGTVLYSDYRIIKDSLTGNTLDVYNENGNSVSEPWSHIASVGAVYNINNKNNIEISGNYSLTNTFHSEVSNIFIVDSHNNPISTFNSHNTNDEYESEGEASAVFEHSFNKEGDHTLSLETTYTAYDEKEDLKFEENHSFPKAINSTDKFLIQKNGTQTEVKSEYVLPINEDEEFNAGYVGEFYFDEISYTKKINSNRFQLNQAIHALYGIYKKCIDDFSFQIGLRSEIALLKSHLVVPTDSLINNNYFKLYPTIHLAYSVSENQDIKVSYSKRVNRPDADELNPFLEYSNPRFAEAGNPDLKPEQIHSLELTYQLSTEKLTFTPSLYYRYKYDAFTFISKPIGNNVILYTSENLATEQSGGLEIIISGNATEWLELDLSGNLFYNQIDASNIGYSNKKDIIAASAKLNTFIDITQSTFLQLNFYYYSPSITPQGKIEARYYMNAGLKQQLFNKKIDLIFTISDIFHTYKLRWNVDTNELVQNTSIYRKEPVYYLGINWRFGNSEKEGSKLKFEGEGLRR